MNALCLRKYVRVKGYMLHDSLYWTFSNRPNKGHGKLVCGFQGLGWEDALSQRSQKNWGFMEMLHILITVVMM